MLALPKQTTNSNGVAAEAPLQYLPGGISLLDEGPPPHHSPRPSSTSPHPHPPSPPSPPHLPSPPSIPSPPHPFLTSSIFCLNFFTQQENFSLEFIQCTYST